MNNLQYKAQEYPGLVAAALVAAVGLGIKALTSYGLNITPEMETFVMAMAWIVIPAAGAYAAMRWTTPLIRPQDNEGNELTAEQPPLPNVP